MRHTAVFGTFLLGATFLLTALSRPARSETVVRIAGTEVTREQITNEFHYSSPALINQIRRSDNSARLLAVEWYSNFLISKAAVDDGLLNKLPGLDAAADAVKRKVISGPIVEARIREAAPPTDTELQQLMAQRPELCRKPPSTLVGRVVAVVGRNASATEKDGARQRLELAKKRLDAGEDLAAVALQVSDLSDQNGLAGSLDHENIDRLGAGSVIRNLSPGAVSEPVALSDSLAIFKVVDRKSEQVRTFSECRTSLVDSINEKYRSDMARDWINELATRYSASFNMDAFVAAVRAVGLPEGWLDRQADQMLPPQ